uniref:protein-serine/threonine phosphatase n=1 Tax=Leptobrachium leishanense TaxID=445787 RepID=A0A8C5MH83_9ANUR
MALVTLQLSPLDRTVSATPAKNDEKRKKQMQRRQSFVMVKGAALLLQEEGEQEQVTEPPLTSGPKKTLRLAVCLEPVRSCVTRYLLMVYFVGTSSVGETILLGVEFPHDGSQDCPIGMVLPVLANTQVFLDGDAGFSVTSGTDVSAFKTISVQTMWSLLQMLHKTCKGALAISILESTITWEFVGLFRAVRMHGQLPLTYHPPSRTPAHQKEEIDRILRKNLRDILRESDLENIKHTLSNLQDYTEFIDNKMIIILAQMDRHSEIFTYLYLGSEWNASNLDDLQKNKVSHILNVTREIGKSFREQVINLNIRVLDEENTNLLQYWKETPRFISSARPQHSCVLVHCKMGISLSASTVIAYAMKQYEWTMEEAFKYVKERRNIVQPNAGFMRQLHIYQGILGASKQQHNVLWDPKSTPLTHELSNPLKKVYLASEVVTDKDDSNMEEVCGNPMKEDNLFEDQNERKSGEENEKVCTAMPGNSCTEEIISSIEKDENTSVDEVFGSTSHKPQSPPPQAASSSDVDLDEAAVKSLSSERRAKIVRDIRGC